MRPVKIQAAIVAVLIVACSRPQPLRISTAAFNAGDRIPKQYTCDGENIPPPVSFRNPPGNSRSLAVVLDDPDAPGGLFTHWIVWNIPPAEASVMAGTEGTNDFGKKGYGGPCPPHARHRYVLHCFALDTMLQLAPGSDRKAFDAAMRGHVLAEGKLEGWYERP